MDVPLHVEAIAVRRVAADEGNPARIPATGLHRIPAPIDGESVHDIAEGRPATASQQYMCLIAAGRSVLLVGAVALRVSRRPYRTTEQRVQPFYASG